jgi:hypothetical protein
MAGTFLCHERINQTRRELNCLRGELEKWIRDRLEEDGKAQHQYQTQLTDLQVVLVKALDRIRDGVEGVAEAAGPAAVYVACRRWDNCIVRARRLWTFYREKFDQRQDPRLRDVLRAADEVVWSCYAEAFRNALPAGTHKVPSAPLPYLDAQFTPLAITRAEIPAPLKGDERLGTDVLNEVLPKMPVPVVALPLSCVQAPWQLVYLGHEVGHHLQSDLGDTRTQLVTQFRGQLEGAVKGQGAKDRWGPRNQELFADVASVYALGPWAAWAMCEMELADAATMLRRKEGQTVYPPAVVRLAHLAQLTTDLGFDGQALLSAFDLDPRKVITGPPVYNDAGEDLRVPAGADLGALKEVSAAVRDVDLADRGKFEDIISGRRGPISGRAGRSPTGNTPGSRRPNRSWTRGCAPPGWSSAPRSPPARNCSPWPTPGSARTN